jgi:hypothetical protein
MQPDQDREAIVGVGSEQVTVAHRGGACVVTASILGMDGPAEAPERIYLDRLVHRPDQTQLGPWRVEGAISTILVAPNRSSPQSSSKQ